MAMPYRKLTSNKNLGRDEKVPFEQQLNKLEEDIRKLKIDYDIFFAGGTKRAPHESRGRVESMIKRIADDRSINFTQRYQYNTVVSKFISYRELWRRMFKARGIDMGV